MNWVVLACIFAVLICSGSVKADTVETSNAQDRLCPSADVFGEAMINDVCWSCLFPMYMFNAKVRDGWNEKPSSAADQAFCTCDMGGLFNVYGGTVGFWAPTRLLEVTRKEWCFPTLFGAEINDPSSVSAITGMGGQGKDMYGNRSSYLATHMYAFPLMQMLNLFSSVSCNPDNYLNFDLMFMSESFPNWNDSELAFLINPETVLFANPVAQAAQVADCNAATAPDSDPIDAMFWSVGCWGSTYPLTGKTINNASHAKIGSLTSTRFMFMMSRIGMIRHKTGEEALCEGKWMPIMKKSIFRMQQLWPVSESSSVAVSEDIDRDDTADENASGPGVISDGDVNTVDLIDMGSRSKTCCHKLGSSDFAWGMWRNEIGVSGNTVFLLWNWTDCCIGLVGG